MMSSTSHSSHDNRRSQSLPSVLVTYCAVKSETSNGYISGVFSLT